MLTACSNPGDTPTGASVGHDCETEPAPATSGGDHGPAWGTEANADGVDDTGEPKLDVGMLVESDPVQWESHSLSGIHYRSPTNDERSAYGWTADHLLVIANEAAFTDEVLAATTSAHLALPIHDNHQGRPQTNLQIANVPLSREYTHAAIPYLETVVQPSGAITHSSLWPTVSFYLPTGAEWTSVPNRLVAVTATSRGGISAHGAAEDERFWVRGPYKDGVHFDLEIAPLDGRKFFVLFTIHDHFPAPLMARNMGVGGLAELVSMERSVGQLAAEPSVSAAQVPIGQCVDGLDNDFDDDADDCDYNCVVHKDFGGDAFDYRLQNEYSKDFTIIGDLAFCAKHVDPVSEIDLIATEATYILNNVQPPGEWAPAVRTPPFRLAIRHCFKWEDATDEEIRDCHENAGNCPALLNYPFAGTLDTPAGIFNKAWEAFEASIENKSADAIRPVHIAAVLSGRFFGVNGATPGYLIGNPSSRGRVVVWDESKDSNGPGGTLAHEIGHTFGLAHDGAIHEGTGLPGFMQGVLGSWAPVLDWDAESDISNVTQGEIWRDLVPSKFEPRASGFKATGCGNPTDCDSYPGLSCVDGQCI